MAGAPSQVGVITQLPGGQLVGRHREREVLHRLLAAADGGEPGVLVVHGQPGVGKTALLEWAIDAAPEFRVVRAAGVEAEMELPFAALQQLCAPILDLMARLPQPQRDALAVAFGLTAGQAPNPFLVGLAVLGLQSEAAEERPLLCVVDDAQWLDGASARALAFVARRLLAEKIALLFATRDLGDALARLPELQVEPLGHRDARLLLETALPARLDERVLERVVAETHGNPLALLELPRELTPAQLAGGFGLPAAAPLSASIEESFRRRLARLPHDARRLLLIAAADPVGDPALARETYLEALSAAMFAGRLAAPGGGAQDVAQAASAAPAPPVARGPDLLLDGLVMLFSDGYEAAVPILRRAQGAFDAAGMPATEQLRWKWLATVSAGYLWDDSLWETLSGRHVELAREAGALGELPLALSQSVYVHLFAGELGAAASLVHEIEAATEAIGSDLAPYGAVGLVALRGHEAEAASLIDRGRADVTRRGEGIGLAVLDWAEAVLYNGLGRYEQALAAAARVPVPPQDLSASNWAMAELIEAAVRAGAPEGATEAHGRLVDVARVSGTEWALGLAARSGALLTEGQRAEDLYVEAIDRLGRSRMAVDLARAHLLYGEWLRRERRRSDAREQLRVAHGRFSDFGMEAFAERARIELEATGEHARKRTVDTLDQLTPQESQIARLAADGNTNRQIAAQLFISPSTVEYHLRKAFRKLDVKSRTQLARRLS